MHAGEFSSILLCILFFLYRFTIKPILTVNLLEMVNCHVSKLSSHAHKLHIKSRIQKELLEE